MFRCLLPSLFFALSFIYVTAQADGPAVGVTKVWIREAPPTISMLAGYFTLENFTAGPLTITSVSSPDFGSVTLHQTVQKNGVDSMQTVGRMVIPAHKSVIFMPGGYHLMLMDPRKKFYAGDLITLTLNFSDHSSLTIMAPVRRDAPQH